MDGGRQVAEAALGAARDALGDAHVAGYLIGSLAHGGFAPAVSDIDVAVIVERCDARTGEVLAGAADRVARSSGDVLAQRISCFWADWATFAAPGPHARFPAVDRLDLMEHGVLVHGRDERAERGTVPGPAELVADTRRFLAARPLERHDPVALVRGGPRPLTKAVLFPVRFLYTLHTGRADGNAQAAAWYRGDARPLVDAAMRWRAGTVEPAEAEWLVAAHLDALQDECAAAYAAAAG